MRPPIRALTSLSAALLLLNPAAAQPQPPRYTATPLSLPGRLFWDYAGLNNAGLVACTVREPETDRESGVLYDSQTLTAQFVPRLPNSDWELVVDVNEAGLAVGTASTTPGAAAPVVIQSGLIQPLPEPNPRGGQAFRAGPQNSVVGYTSSVTYNTPHPAVWNMTDGGWQVHTLSAPTPYGGMANDINSQGVVAGWVHTSYEELRPAIWHADQRTLLPSLGGSWAQAFQINDAGQVACLSSDASGQLRGYVWQDGQVTHIADGLPGRTEIYDMNQHGDVVGSHDGRAFLFRDGQTFDLNSLLDEPLTPALYRASAINDLGQILCVRWTVQDGRELVLLSPVPAPSACLLLASGVSLPSRRRRRAAT